MSRKIFLVSISMMLITSFFSAEIVTSQGFDNSISLNEVKDKEHNSLVMKNNNPPNPPLIAGPTSGRIGETYFYYVTITDPDLDDVMFNLEIDFGDDKVYIDCGCGKSWQNGTILEVSHLWKKVGNYGITARVQDASGEWSEWSKPLPVSMPRIKELLNLYIWLSDGSLNFFPFFERLIDIFPRLDALRSRG